MQLRKYVEKLKMNTFVFGAPIWKSRDGASSSLLQLLLIMSLMQYIDIFPLPVRSSCFETSSVYLLLYWNFQTHVIFPDVQEKPLLIQMQAAAGSGEAEMETESPGGISETFHSKPLFSLLELISVTPPSFPQPWWPLAGISGLETHWCFCPTVSTWSLSSAWFLFPSSSPMTGTSAE